MQIFKTLLIVTAALAPSALAGCSGAPYQGTCLSCTSDCHDNFGGPDRTSSLQRTGCMFACLMFCDDCD
ncbi:hypothetical protein Cob_v011955 [Colletotrichum orbiculare MAFF 240422]|uniref:Uncharacterized protein n=2 Tax=Colletotrichum orbiculare species complex TaxID=2707354 RepID=N4VB69_COLOR|nr:hypothetical protein Cob_v011955 [Colletotrichum orbiculare MAFF 240422]TDZ27932.1 hypothetical protein C8035_v008656 [Colletotrichum spinosum]